METTVPRLENNLEGQKNLDGLADIREMGTINNFAPEETIRNVAVIESDNAETPVTVGEPQKSASGNTGANQGLPPMPALQPMSEMAEFLREQQKLTKLMIDTAASLGNVTTTMTRTMRDFTAQVTRGPNMNSTFIESVNATNVEASRGNLENLDPQTNPVTQSNYPNMTIIPSFNATLSELNKSIEMNNTQKNYHKTRL